VKAPGDIKSPGALGEQLATYERDL
jgi:hypothetical protein